MILFLQELRSNLKTHNNMLNKISSTEGLTEGVYGVTLISDIIHKLSARHTCHLGCSKYGKGIQDCWRLKAQVSL
jgi:hypothetical protein